ncbi:hypothetical protein HELRODRAFT_177398 [Helobdella robusta]|uniref:C-type lectin domain-containing protein n=1 Tax=Helobdella robusta TaxID=6412 RepID=T1FBM5_HELRO|nr:hypothetical protein HELRODRAFT_177398 [Helobdella robusta]ESN98155.1 hypothetical protein HELRODRAFT_177398 [Helobdella robusta]
MKNESFLQLTKRKDSLTFESESSAKENQIMCVLPSNSEQCNTTKRDGLALKNKRNSAGVGDNLSFSNETFLKWNSSLKNLEKVISTPKVYSTYKKIKHFLQYKKLFSILSDVKRTYSLNSTISINLRSRLRGFTTIHDNSKESEKMLLNKTIRNVNNNSTEDENLWQLKKSIHTFLQALNLDLDNINIFSSNHNWQKVNQIATRQFKIDLQRLDDENLSKMNLTRKEKLKLIFLVEDYLREKDLISTKSSLRIYIQKFKNDCLVIYERVGNWFDAQNFCHGMNGALFAFVESNHFEILNNSELTRSPIDINAWTGTTKHVWSWLRKKKIVLLIENPTKMAFTLEKFAALAKKNKRLPSITRRRNFNISKTRSLSSSQRSYSSATGSIYYIHGSNYAPGMNRPSAYFYSTGARSHGRVSITSTRSAPSRLLTRPSILKKGNKRSPKAKKSVTLVLEYEKSEEKIN